MRMIGVVTVARSDYSIYLPILKAIEKCDDLVTKIFAAGSHLSPEFGMTINDIENDGFSVDSRINMLLSSDDADGVAKSIGLGVIGFAQEYSKSRPDILLLLGDRFEMLSAAIAALPFTIPIAHIHGGEVTEGAIDDSIRHSITKLSHIHFVSTTDYARRIIQLGEEAWRVHVCGAPSLDNLLQLPLLNQKELEKVLDLDLSEPTILVTYHPVTLEMDETEFQVKALLAAIDVAGKQTIFTYPNADMGGRLIRRTILDFVESRKNAVAYPNLGTNVYFSLMKFVKMMVGNSSSGIIEAASFQLPVVNIGNRQSGRVKGPNVIDVGYSSQEILNGIEHASNENFIQKLKLLSNPYGKGDSAWRIVEVIKLVPLDNKLLRKRFVDLNIDGVFEGSTKIV